MQPNNRSSFIPKKSIKKVERVRGGKRVYILSYVAYSVFFATLIAAGAVFFYSQFLEKELAKKIQDLETQRAAFSQSNIQKIKEVERQLKMADYFFNRHSSPYAVLYELEKFVVDKITFNTFDYKRVDADFIELKVSGGTDKFDGVAFQSGLLIGSKILKAAEFSSINKQGDFSTTQESNTAKTKAASDEEEQVFPVNFTINKTLTFDELAFDPSVFSSSVITTNQNFETGSSTGEVTSFTSDSDAGEDLGEEEFISNEFEQ